jgi:hypothetical protein
VSGMSEQTATAAVGPMLRMCVNPDCGGEGACDRIPDRPTFAYKATWELGDGRPEEAGDVWARDMLADSFARCSASAVDGGPRNWFIPDGAEFTVHKGDQGLPEGERRPGHVTYAAVYSGTAPRDELMAAAPPYDPEKAKARVNLMKQAREADDRPHVWTGSLEKTDACWP